MDKKGNPSFVEDVNKLQVIKCVVVGDRAVGKSHLVCAKACGTKYNLRDLVQMHVSTIWAVDHYRTSPDVKRRSICTVECVTCSLRLWDTFGTHDKDRQFAYSSADVILACFSVASRRSLKHIETHWMPEVYHYCGHIPVVLCACQIDMRYLYKDPTYVTMAREASLLKVKEEDIVLPEEGKDMARRLGLYYYESSVLVQYGIDEVFSNCVRAALISKRRGKILVGLGNLKNVVQPHLQVPHMPPRPPPPKVLPYAKEKRDSSCDVTMLSDSFFTDVVFLVHQQRIEAHGVYLAAASAVFQTFLEEAFCINRTKYKTSALCVMSGDCLGSSQETLKGSSFTQMMYEQKGQAAEADANTDETSDRDTGLGEADDDDDEEEEEKSQGSSWRSLSSQVPDGAETDDDFAYTKHSARHRSVSAQQQQQQHQSKPLTDSYSISTGRLLDCDSIDRTTEADDRDSGFRYSTPTISSSVLSCQNVEFGETFGKLVVAVDDTISPAQFQLLLRYLYTGELQEDVPVETLLELMRVARLFSLDDMERQIENVLNGEPFVNVELKRKFQEEKTNRLRMLLHNLNFLSDVTFELDDGTLCGHRAILASRCDVLSTMFMAEFSERRSGHASFPGVSRDGFIGVMEYLYTGQCPTTCKDWTGLVELSDRFFLKDLLLSAEIVIIKELGAALEAAGADVETALALIGPAKLHGATQLFNWCVWFLKVNYKDLVENYACVFETFDDGLQAELTHDRWPPVWYLREVEIYERAMLEMNKLLPQQAWLRRNEGDACISPGGCLSF